MNKQNTANNSKKTKLAVAVTVGFCWAWLPFIDAAAISNNKFIATLITLFVYAVIVTLQSYVAYTCYKLFQKYKPAQNWTQLASVFLVSSFLLWFLAWISCFIWYGEGASIDNVLPFTSLTPFIVYTPLKYLVQLFGFYGTTAVFTTLAYAIFKQRWRRGVAVIGIGILLSNVLLWAAYKTPNGQNITVHISSQQLASPTHIKSDANLLLLPEYGLDDITNDNLSSRVSGNPQTAFIGSKQTYTNQGNQNTLLYGTVGLGILEEHQKSRLIVGGEYLAYTVEPWLKLLSPNTVTNFEVSRKVLRGNEGVKTIALSNGIVVGPAVCSSILSTEDYRSLTRQGAGLLTNSASLEIFRGSRLFDIQHRGFATFMAVSNARPFAQSSNNWPAFALDHQGKLVVEILPTSDRVITVQTNSKKTPYTLLGEWPVVLGALLIVASIAQKLRNRHRKTTP